MNKEIEAVARVLLGQFRNCAAGDQTTWESHMATISLQVPTDHRKFLEGAVNWLCQENAIKLIKHPQPMIEITQGGLDLLHRLEQAS